MQLHANEKLRTLKITDRISSLLHTHTRSVILRLRLLFPISIVSGMEGEAGRCVMAFAAQYNHRNDHLVCVEMELK